MANYGGRMPYKERPIFISGITCTCPHHVRSPRVVTTCSKPQTTYDKLIDIKHPRHGGHYLRLHCRFVIQSHNHLRFICRPKRVTLRTEAELSWYSLSVRAIIQNNRVNR